FSYDDIAKLFDIFNEHPHGALNAISRNPYRLIDYFPISTIDSYIKNLYWEEDSYARLSSIVDFFYN
ncbi:helix-hairpin-helix domain-containing protein, partial [Vibrio parahaemolyticus]